MEHIAPKHEKIRFRREEIVRLGDLPSAGGQERIVPEPKASFGIVVVIGWILAFLLVVACAVPAALFLFGIPGIGGERIRAEAEAALNRLAGFDVDAEMGDPRLSVDGSRFLALQVDDVRISDGREGTSLVEAGSLRFGLRFLPLLSGKVQLGSAGVEDAIIRLPSLPGSGGANAALGAMTGPDGLIDPGLVMKAVFVAIHRAFDGFDAGSTRKVDFANVEVVLPKGIPGGSLHLETAKIEREASGAIAFEADATLGGRAFRLEGTADRDGAGPEPVSFKADLNVDRMVLERDLVALKDNGQFAVRRLGGAVRLVLSGTEIVGEPGQLGIQARLDDASLEFANGQAMRGGGSIAASFQSQARKIEIERAEL